MPQQPSRLGQPAIDYVPLSPGAMAEEIIRIVDAQDQVERSREAAVLRDDFELGGLGTYIRRRF